MSDKCIDLEQENTKLKQRLDECEKALEGRLGVSDEAVKWACEEYVLAENALPDCFDVEDYQLHNAVESLVDSNARMESTLTRYESALKEANVALDRLSKLGNEPHLGNSFGNRIAQDALAKINQVLGEK